MRKIYFTFVIAFLFIGCKEKPSKDQSEATVTESFTVTYAEGFSVTQKKGYKVLTIHSPWPGADVEYRYALVEKGDSIDDEEDFDAVLETPVTDVVVTSTTHIPSLEMLGETERLVGFPNLDYISSEETRKRIADGQVKELGKNESLNTEVLIDLAPDAVVTFAVESANKTVATIEKTGIPVLYNADWTETHPLGKAEWIKFFGLLFNKEKQADSIFTKIETEYLAAKKLAQQASEAPTVMAGAMYKDVWYLPQGDSWAAQFIEDAKGGYLWAKSEGSGSLSLNLESVLEKAKNADIWIAPGQYDHMGRLSEAHEVYAQFKAFQENRVYNYTANKGETGGVIYYELAPNRPDLVLKDLIKIFHPSLLPDYKLYFFSQLK
ncbi:ABC transporter substrate-binding protein [Luteirhabdus pelagi]|uniref:ABC transporter substrate-binding protein n=1 Tax=Luteirhabdus pelagi TaxID=2792783 RepID=UPI00193A81FA|nr:ABC transporter substrate-binding protein [Luteirhabdus pelagi]